MTNPFDHGYFTEDELRGIGLKSVGENVKIDKTCTIIGIENIEIGNNVRIDGYTTLIASGGHLRVGSYVHIAGYCHLSCGAGVFMGDFSGLSQGVRIYSKTDDYSGCALTNPTVPSEYTAVMSGAVNLGRHVIVGSGSILLPGTAIGEGSAVGALSLVNRALDEWGVYFGIPAKRLKPRSRDLLAMEQRLLLQGGNDNEKGRE